MTEPSSTDLAALFRWLCLWCLPTLGIAGAVAWLLNVPALRMERARLFLDVLKLGLGAGRSPEDALVSVSASRDLSLGARFHLLAAQIGGGVRFAEALRRATNIVPANIGAMLVAGHEAGVLPGALQAARRAARLPDAEMRTALSCQIVMLFILNPLILVTLPFFLVKIFPVLGEITAGFGVKPPVIMTFLSRHAAAIFLCQLFSILGLYLSAIFYVGGNRFARWLEAGLFPISAWVALRIPWKRKRLHRDFASMLALLLDAGLPEAKALALAASSVANEIFAARAQSALNKLAGGMHFCEALELLDPPKEFTWRLANALRRKGNFSAALEGWFEALDAETDAQEQAAGDLLSTGLLVANGLIVAMVLAAVMQAVYGFSVFPVS